VHNHPTGGDIDYRIRFHPSSLMHEFVEFIIFNNTTNIHIPTTNQSTIPLVNRLHSSASVSLWFDVGIPRHRYRLASPSPPHEYNRSCSGKARLLSVRTHAKFPIPREWRTSVLALSATARHLRLGELFLRVTTVAVERSRKRRCAPPVTTAMPWCN